MFGDNEAYFNKFTTCVRTRPRESQKLGKEFYEQEHLCRTHAINSHHYTILNLAQQ